MTVQVHNEVVLHLQILIDYESFVTVYGSFINKVFKIWIFLALHFDFYLKSLYSTRLIENERIFFYETKWVNNKARSIINLMLLLIKSFKK